MVVLPFSKLYTYAQAHTGYAVSAGKEVDLGGDIDGKIATDAQSESDACIEIGEGGCSVVCACFAVEVAIVGIGNACTCSVGELSKFFAPITFVGGINGYGNTQSLVAKIDVKSDTYSGKVVVIELVAVCGGDVARNTLVDECGSKRGVVYISAITLGCKVSLGCVVVVSQPSLS